MSTTHTLRRAIALLPFLVPGAAAAAHTDTNDARHDVDETGMAVVLVMGEQPGPGLWKVTAGDHEMWILGEVSPIPRRVEWRSRKFEKLLRQSQEVLLDFSGYWAATKHEMSQYRKAEKLPEGTMLANLIAPRLYERVASTAKLFDTRGFDDLYPFAATNRLVMASMKALDLKGFSARFAASEMAKRRDIKITYYAPPELPFEQRLEIWKQDANIVCLERVLDVLHDGGEGVKRLANAWSVGDVEALRDLVPKFSFSRDGFRAGECSEAMRGGEKEYLEFKSDRIQGWLSEAERALKENRRTMAVVLMSDIFAPDGYIAGLRARGYEIVEPR
jgi:hypothetical protein